MTRKQTPVTTVMGMRCFAPEHAIADMVGELTPLEF